MGAPTEARSTGARLRDIVEAVDDDAALLEAWRAGDQAAGDRLVRRHFAVIYRFFRNKVDGDVDDLVQKTFLKCTNARASIREGGSFRAYLFATARNVLKDHYRSRGRDRLDLTSVSALDLGISPSQLIEEKQEHRLLLAALRAIPVDDQIALELVYWEQLKAREIAEIFDIPEGTARTRLRRARLSLEAKLAELSRSPQLLASTLDNLERWSASIRDAMGVRV